MITQLVGFAVEKMALEKMDPNAAIGANGQTVQEELNRIAQTTQAMRDLRSVAEPLLPTLTDEDMVNYINREVLFGAVPAMQWVVNKYGQQQGQSFRWRYVIRLFGETPKRTRETRVLPGYFGFSRVTSSGCLSSRRPRKAGWRK
jgi:hypothetical protein